MIIHKAYATGSGAYKAQNKIEKWEGIIVHSTGANNPNLKRYVNLKELLGENYYKNYFGGENDTRDVCPHYVIGLNKYQEITTCQTLPTNISCWCSGQGKTGNANFNPPHIQFEICEDDLKDEKYFNNVMNEAAELCAILCKTYDLPVSSVISHAEGYKKGIASNHGDIDHWLKIYNKDMNWFRSKVSSYMKKSAKVITITASKAVDASKVSSYQTFLKDNGFTVKVSK